MFPEGTTTDGARLLPFRPALFQPAVAGGHPVRPLALAYRDGAGRRCAEAAYIGDMNLWQSLCAIAALPELTLEIRCCGAIRHPRPAPAGSRPPGENRVHGAGSGSSAGWRPSSTGPTWASAAEVSRT